MLNIQVDSRTPAQKVTDDEGKPQVPAKIEFLNIESAVSIIRVEGRSIVAEIPGGRTITVRKFEEKEEAEEFLMTLMQDKNDQVQGVIDELRIVNDSITDLGTKIDVLEQQLAGKENSKIDAKQNRKQNKKETE